jgi:hypothetical protein
MDWLPMTIEFMSMVAAIIAERRQSGRFAKPHGGTLRHIQL